MASFPVQDILRCRASNRPKGVLDEKAMKDDTFLRECTPGYYNNEGKDQRNSIWLSNYGGGPFEYMDVLLGWIGSDQAIARDLTLTPAK